MQQAIFAYYSYKSVLLPTWVCNLSPFFYPPISGDPGRLLILRLTKLVIYFRPKTFAALSKRKYHNELMVYGLVSDSSKSTHLSLAGTNGQSRVRRSETSEFDGMFAHQGGVVDECCKKQCTLTTLASYCANSQDLGHVNLHDLFPSEAQNIIISEEAVAELPQVNNYIVLINSFITNANKEA